jgi:hypothetical protein
MQCFLLKYIVVLNSVLPFWKMMAYEFLLGASEILPCSVSAPQADIVPRFVKNMLPEYKLYSKYVGYYLKNFHPSRVRNCCIVNSI